MHLMYLSVMCFFEALKANDEALTTHARSLVDFHVAALSRCRRLRGVALSLGFSATGLLHRICMQPGLCMHACTAT